jgi:hypothetical protein
MKLHKTVTTGGELLPVARAEKVTATRPAGIISEVLVPFLEAALSGVIVSSMLTFLIRRSGYDGNWFHVWVGLAPIVGTAAYIGLLLDTRKLLWSWEKLWNRDMNNDGEIGQPKLIRPYGFQIRPDNGDVKVEPVRESAPLDPQFIDLIWFLEESMIRGLQRENWLVNPRPVSRTGQRMSRGYYDKLVQYASDEFGLLTPGGGGVATEWAVKPQAAIQMLKKILAMFEDVENE